MKGEKDARRRRMEIRTQTNQERQADRRKDGRAVRLDTCVRQVVCVTQLSAEAINRPGALERERERSKTPLCSVVHKLIFLFGPFVCSSITRRSIHRAFQ
mmetsp:Transcript_31467/g.62187  ORF Transcript_31467/g.62187 Transcript_31467/m.62187 type:complete len:100 (-) Transcript_31467:323-622(-)